LLAESFVVALSCTEVPTRRGADAGLTVTDATGTAETVTLELLLCPSLVAVMVAVPMASALTNPSTETDATLGASLDQVIVRPLNRLPDESSVEAMKSALVPTRRLAVAGETCTIATAQAGTYYVRLKAYSAFSGVSLTGSYTAGGGGGGGTQTYTTSTPAALPDLPTITSTITVSGRTGNAPTTNRMTTINTISEIDMTTSVSSGVEGGSRRFRCPRFSCHDV
jgi:hypothetical protein